jgi:streptogramin lyase
VRISIGLVSLTGALLLAGCSGMVTSTGGSVGVQGAAIKGTVHGGQNPISGAHVYLYAANTTGYGSASTSLLTAHANTTSDGSNYYATTDANGLFSITGDYVCPAAVSQLYLYAVGGNSGSGANSGAGLLAALGTCQANGTLSASLFVMLNEVSTVATAYAISGYATDATHVSSSGTALALVGIANAFSTVPNLENLASGLALSTTPGGNGAVPQNEINTLADILGACINTASSSSSGCSTLFNNAKNGSVVPTDTATAAINIAHNPTLNVATLYGLVPAVGAPFQPTLAAAPNDFSIAVNYTGGGLNYPAVVAVDATGNVWTSNFQNNTLSKFTTLGVPYFPTGATGGGMNGPYGLAIDSVGSIWVANYTSPVLSKFDTGGNPISSTGYTGGGLSSSLWMNVDKTGNLWISNDPDPAASAPGSISEFDSNGTAKSPITTGYTAGGVNRPEMGAADVSGNIWFPNILGDGITEYTAATGVANASSPYTGAGLNHPVGLAIDASGNKWVSNRGNDTISKFDSAMSPVSFYSGGGLHLPEKVAIDGNGNVWVVNYGGNSLSEFDSNGSAISTTNGFQGYMSAPHWLAIDGSGNIWVANNSDVNLTEFVGLAAPVVTPVVADLLTPYGVHAANKP